MKTARRECIGVEPILSGNFCALSYISRLLWSCPGEPFLPGSFVSKFPFEIKVSSKIDTVAVCVAAQAAHGAASATHCGFLAVANKNSYVLRRAGFAQHICVSFQLVLFEKDGF